MPCTTSSTERCPPALGLGEEPLLQVADCADAGCQSLLAVGLVAVEARRRPGVDVGEVEAATHPQRLRKGLRLNRFGCGGWDRLQVLCRAARAAFGLPRLLRLLRHDGIVASALPVRDFPDTLAGQRGEPGDRPEVLLAVAAVQHLLAEQLGRRARRRRRTGHLAVVEPVGEHDQPQRDDWSATGSHVASGTTAVDAVDQRAVAAGVHAWRGGRARAAKSSREAPGVARAAARRPPRRRTAAGPRAARGGGSPRRRSRSDVEVRGQALDLAQEVGGGEPALAELAGQRVGGRGERDAGVDQPPSSVETSTVSPGSSSSNSSMHSSRWPLRASTVCWKPSAPTRLVSSTKVPNAFGAPARVACHSEASRWVLPTP